MAVLIDYYVSLNSPWTHLGAARIEALAAQHGAELRIWPVDFGTIFAGSGGLPLPKRSPQRQAYRMQELAYGGLSSDTRNLLRDLADGKKTAPKRKPRERLAVGTRLIRVHNGVEHRVTVLAKGYEYNGRVYRTLSGVAKGITGTVWNGYVFFGLKKYDDPRVAS